MLVNQIIKQKGYALLMFVVALLGVGGIALTGVNENIRAEAEAEKFKHNQRVLKEAKRALLQYAYNYPEEAGNGPGRLPCVDTDNDGQSNTVFGSCDILGRFPWGELFLRSRDLRDADGQRLWYAVSSNFATNTASTVNSDTLGTISIRDQTGSLVYGFSANSGVAAVIIAPGKVLARNGTAQDRSVSNADDPFDAVADDDTGIIDEANYLDVFFGSEDNSTFSQSSNTDGFILGPIIDSNNEKVVNDQIIIITAAEVIAIAEQSVLNSYKLAINEYLLNIGITRYPWLVDYSTTDLSVYDAGVDTNIGRVPSMFANYFDDTITIDSQIITSDIKLRMGVSVNGFPVLTEDTLDVDAAVQFNTSGDLLITPSANGASFVRYYWDEIAVPDGWEECLSVVMSGTEQDCNQATAAPGVPNSLISPNEVPTRVLQITYAVDFVNATTFSRDFSDKTATALAYPALTGAGHAYVFAQYAEADLGDEISIRYVTDNNYDAVFNDQGNGDVDYFIGIRYYPVLPVWALNSEDNWHDSVQMAFSLSYALFSGDGDCTNAVADCLTVNGVANPVNNKVALLAIASSHALVDEGADGFQNDLVDIFDAGNDDIDLVFETTAVGGDDSILILN